jgi:ATP-dependent Clp protease ATP-binding subunit ClpA
MHERFSDRARHAMALANQEAITLGHGHLGAEHILLGLLAERTSVGASVLTNLNVDFVAVQKRIADALEQGADHGLGRRPHSPETKQVIDSAINEARKLGHRYVGTEHLLLGICSQPESIAAQVLGDSGVRLESLREEVLAALRVEVDEHHDVESHRHGLFEWVHQQELAKAFRSPAFWHTMILAVDSANRLGTGEVMPEHLLLALLRDSEGRVARLLRQKDVSADWIREQIMSGKVEP